MTNLRTGDFCHRIRILPVPYNDLVCIADGATAPDQRAMAMKSFAQELDWIPSYEVQGTFGVSSIAGHLIVEHGLENAAAITFLKSPFRSSELGADQLKALLAVSYNNLIEWHLFISGTDARWINNLADRAAGNADRVIQLDPNELLPVVSSSKLDELDRTSNFRRSIRSCDEALLQIVSRWKLLLKADYPTIENRNLSALFNALIFVRGCEDRNLDRAPGSTRVLLDSLGAESGDQINVLRVLRNGLLKTGISNKLSDFVREDDLAPFESLDFATAFNLFRELYAPKDAAYDFNFALMSKHALSRIYEKYVALLQPEDETKAPVQLSLIRPIPKEIPQYKSGAIYTPQFVAGFFARFLRENLTPRSFRDLRSIDPACGSGLFLRNLLELQADPFAPGITSATISRAFSQTEGIDRDINACEATRLSLALLHLIATGNLPKASDLRVTNGDAINAIMTGKLERRAYGAVMTNPPYVKLDHLSSADRELYSQYLGAEYAGRLDAYIPFVRLCLELTQPGGITCLVLPQTFLTAANASVLRRAMSEEFNIRCLIDLSAVPVFENVGTYTILLILQRKKSSNDLEKPMAQIAQVTESVGAALQACLDGRMEKTEYYSVFAAAQSTFSHESWVIVSPEQLIIDERLSYLPKLSDFMTVTQGFVTGADKVFIRAREAVPRGEERIYFDFLPDRQIGRYSVPRKTTEVVFSPFDGERPLAEEELADRFPKTWSYLLSKREELEARRSVTHNKVPWWKPVRSRDPSSLLRPKIVCPHLMLTPRFAINPNGRLTVSHSPYIFAKDRGEEQALIRFFCAVLNSTVCNWYIRTYSPKYGRGYNRLEVNLLNGVPVPDLTKIDAKTLSLVTDAVDRLSAKSDERVDDDLDDLICGLYGFTPTERRKLFGLK
jgi:N-6 DNA Methylase/TaqI-like C-terminal specificity domain